MGEEGVAAARRISNLDSPELSFSNFLSRPIMITNAVLRKMQGYGSERTMKELARLMKPENKAELAKLIEEEVALRASREGWKPASLRGIAVGSGVSASGTPAEINR